MDGVDGVEVKACLKAQQTGIALGIDEDRITHLFHCFRSLSKGVKIV